MKDTVFISKRSADRKQKLTEVYKSAFPSVAKYVSRMGGTLDDAKDLFHDAVIVYYEKNTADPDFLINSSEKAYILGIVKNMWKKRYSQNDKSLSIDDNKHSQIQDEKEKGVSAEKLLNFLEAAGKKCMDMLQSFYYEKLSAEEIAGRFGFSTGRSATVQKYKCLEKVRNVVKSKSIGYEDFLD